MTIKTIVSAEVDGLNEILEEIFGDHLVDWVVLNLTDNPKLKGQIPHDIMEIAEALAEVESGDKIFISVRRA
jgi:maleate cis-trans isomerase